MSKHNRKRERFDVDENWDQDRSRHYRQDDYPENYRNVNRDYDPERDFSYRNRQEYGGSGYQGGYSEAGSYRNIDEPYDPQLRRQEGRRGYYGANYQGYGRSDYDREYGGKGYSGREEDYYKKNIGEPRNRYGGDTSNYGNANQGGFDRDWWDRTRDEVSSWFGDDEAEKRRRMDKVSGPNRGKGPKGYHRSVERIREDVCDRLCDNPVVDASDIEVKVEGTDVILTGTVHSREEKRKAEDIAESVYGVSNVQNQLRVNRYERDDSSRSANE